MLLSRPATRAEDLKSLWAFQEKLSQLEHFHTGYDNIEHLKRQFRDQLDKMLEELTIENKAEIVSRITRLIS